MKNLENKVKERIKELENKELQLFHSYNRHSTSECKLSILDKISNTIILISELKQLLQ